MNTPRCPIHDTLLFHPAPGSVTQFEPFCWECGDEAKGHVVIEDAEMRAMIKEEIADDMIDVAGMESVDYADRWVATGCAPISDIDLRDVAHLMAIDYLVAKFDEEIKGYEAAYMQGFKAAEQEDLDAKREDLEA